MRAVTSVRSVEAGQRPAILHVLGRACATSIPYEVATHQRQCGYDVHVASILAPLDSAVTDDELTVLGGLRHLVPRLRKLVDSDRFDVIHVHHGVASLAAAALARLARIPVVVSEHRAEGVTRPLQIGRGLLASRITTNSEFTRSTMPALLRKLRTVDVVHNGVDLDAVAAGSPEAARKLWPAGQPVVLCVGRLIADKGQETLLRAAAKAEQPFTVVLAGDGPEKEALEELAAELRITDRVVMLGRQPRSAVYDAMAAATIVVVPSRTEGFCNVAAEALAAGVPLVTSDAGALPEVVEGTAARMVPAGSVSALAEAIDRGLEDIVAGDFEPEPDLTFSLSATLGRLDEIYSQVITG